MTAIAPAITKTTSRVAQKSTRAALRIVADVSAGRQATSRSYALFITAIGVVFLLALLFINTLLAQDAFELSKLQADLKLSSDQYEAITREICALDAAQSKTFRQKHVPNHICHL